MALALDEDDALRGERLESHDGYEVWDDRCGFHDECKEDGGVGLLFVQDDLKEEDDCVELLVVHEVTQEHVDDFREMAMAVVDHIQKADVVQ